MGKDRALNTYRKYLIVRKYVAEFIKKQYKRNDLGMNELTEDFIRDFCLYLRNEAGLEQSSVWIYSTPLKHIVTTAHYHGKIPRNPFAMYHVDPDHKEREYLTEKELRTMSSIKLDDPNFAFARDLFVFGCWTGISFIDIKNLTTDNVVETNGAQWIVSKRQKTGVPFRIKLMDITKRIIKRYEPLRIDNRLFNMASYYAINKRIKSVAKMCGIEKRISFLGGGRLKELEAENRTLQEEVAARDESIAILQEQIQRQQEEHLHQLATMQRQHHKETAEREAKHKEEVSGLKRLIGKLYALFPLAKEILRMESLCRLIGFDERQTATLISGKPLFYEGELYSEEHKRKFKTENAGFQVVKDPTDKAKLVLAINRQSIYEWFREQFDKVLTSMRRTVAPSRKGKGIGL